MAFDSRQFRNVLGQFATGVTVITAWNGDEPQGMTANAFSSVSLDPPLILACVNKEARTHGVIEKAGRFAVNILPEGAEAISDFYAGRPGVSCEVAFDVERAGSPIMPEAVAWLDCVVWRAYDGGDHTIFVGEVQDLELKGGDPLLFFGGRYRRLAP